MTREERDAEVELELGRLDYAAKLLESNLVTDQPTFARAMVRPRIAALRAALDLEVEEPVAARNWFVCRIDPEVAHANPCRCEILRYGDRLPETTVDLKEVGPATPQEGACPECLGCGREGTGIPSDEGGEMARACSGCDGTGRSPVAREEENP